MSTSAISTAPLKTTPAVGDVVYAGANPNAGKTNLDSKDFMKLMITQLSAQDPMEPMKDTEFISQMANFTSLENSRVLSESFKSFTTEQSLASAPAYLGKYVTVKDPTSNAMGEVTGLVEGVVLDDTKPSVVIGGTRYATNLITAVSNTAPPVTTAPAASATSPAAGSTSAPVDASATTKSTTPAAGA